MRLTTRTNLAARILMHCAVNEGQVVRSAEIAEHCNASFSHIAHVVRVLQGNGLIETMRGRTGGICLARRPAAISIGAVFRLFEEEIPFAECFDRLGNTCPLSDVCRLRGHLVRALDAFYRALEPLTLADLVGENAGLDLLLKTPERLVDGCPEPVLTAP